MGLTQKYNSIVYYKHMVDKKDKKKTFYYSTLKKQRPEPKQDKHAINTAEISSSAELKQLFFWSWWNLMGLLGEQHFKQPWQQPGGSCTEEVCVWCDYIITSCLSAQCTTTQIWPKQFRGPPWCGFSGGSIKRYTAANSGSINSKQWFVYQLCVTAWHLRAAVA